MSEVRPIDANELKDSIVENIRELGDQCSPVMLTMFGLFSDIIENAPTIDTSEKYNNGYEKGYKHGYKDGQNSGRPQGDLISRSELKKALEPMAKQMNDSLYGDGIYRALKEIDNAPTVPQVTVFAENASKEEIEDFKQELENVLERPQGEWIPVSERLPEEKVAVLVYVSTGTSKTFCLANWNNFYGGWEDWLSDKLIEKELGYKVIAWQPLPEPYKKGGAE